MKINEIRGMLEREPFEPFRVRASSGVGYDVHNPDMVVLMKSRMLIVEPRSDRFALVPFLHIAGFESLGNGHSRAARRRAR